MKKIIKNYLLFFSSHPISYSFIFGLLVVIIIAVGRAMNGPSQPGFHISSGEIMLVSVLVIIHIILLYIVINKYITRPQKRILWMLYDANPCFFYALKTESGEVMVVDKPVWQKGKKYFVLDPSFYHWGLKEFQVQTMISATTPYSSMGIKVRLSFSLKDDFDRLELVNALIRKQGDNEELNLEEYIVSAFAELNKSHSEEIELIIATHKTTPELLARISDLLTFPERLFSNVLTTTVILDSPLFCSGKKMRD